MTSEIHGDKQLPHVTEDDLLGMIVEEAVDPSHTEWWHIFAKENPELARELLNRVNKMPDNPEARKITLDMTIYAITALRRAATRTVRPHESE